MIITSQYRGVIGHSVTVQWYKDGVALVDGTYGSTIVSGALETLTIDAAVMTTTLTIDNPDESFDGNYSATVTDNDVPSCEITTDNLEVESPAICRLEITVQPVSVETNAGNDIELTVVYEGEAGNVTFQWYKDDVALEDGASSIGTVSGATSATLAIADATTDAAGSYHVILVDDGVLDCSVQSDTATVTVNADCDLEITTQPASQEVLDGGSLVLFFAYTGSGGPFTIQWYFNDTPLVDGASGSSTISGATTETLTITDWDGALAGSFYARVTDEGLPDCMAQTNAAVVTEIAAPSDPYIWYDASQESFSDGDLAFPLQDWSGFNHDAVISSDITPVRPTFQTNELNGLPVFEWGAPDDSFSSCNVYTDPIDLPGDGFPILSSGYTFAIVLKRSESPLHSSFNNLNVVALDGTVTVRARLHSLVSGTSITFTHYGRSTNTAITLPTGADSWQIITGTFDFVEGIPRLRTNDDTSEGSAGAGSVDLNLAQIQGAYLEQVAEVLYYNRKLSDADLDQLRNYLSAKWGITITV